ncbi:chemotaxis-specific protein-glutamate methyltransferase CheB [Nitrosospira sp. NRS527]|uniref:chemotaxis-specific protein-glutamate methyltransferase CheB n=1 Tax=Nitrosospira sp. NRS527 TaxID=155925 RepID=UPI001AF5672C|nr:chemotaxis-specific protein-glutamate methyltransferase CheB [Nitrosospira sp. NRS527]BCT69022.1 Protein-glutamate methylesterase/protein-glutamine glutaminase [Nitrosospira sp. NRS527]
MIRVLVVEDSPVVREFLVYILNSDPDVTVIATACDGEEALDVLRSHRPDVITMDIHMPKLNGLEATRVIMETQPTPIVIVSGSTDPTEVVTTFDAIDAGALAVLRRPAGIGNPDHEATARDLIQVVKLMSEVKVVRRWSRMRKSFQTPCQTSISSLPRAAQTKIVVMGASTGGPPALETILRALPKDFPAPILIVQHMAGGFIEGFVEWLKNSASLPVHVAKQGELPLPGHVYVAPDEYQMKVGSDGRIVLTKDEPEHGLTPSISYLFRSVADVYGHGAIAGLLTGMGRDGAEELYMLKAKGSITFAQDKDSSVVHGMAGEAIKLDAATLILPLQKIAAVLTDLVNDRGEMKFGS